MQGSSCRESFKPEASSSKPKASSSKPEASSSKPAKSSAGHRRRAAPYSYGTGTKERVAREVPPSACSQSAWSRHSRARTNQQKVLPFVKALSNIFHSPRESVRKTSEWGHWKNFETIRITDASSFGKVVVPSFTAFKSLGAFVRELTKHGFKKTPRNCSLEFYHPHFCRAKPHLLRHIRLKSEAKKACAPPQTSPMKAHSSAPQHSGARSPQHQRSSSSGAGRSTAWRRAGADVAATSTQRPGDKRQRQQQQPQQQRQRRPRELSQQTRLRGYALNVRVDECGSVHHYTIPVPSTQLTAGWLLSEALRHHRFRQVRPDQQEQERERDSHAGGEHSSGRAYVGLAWKGAKLELAEKLHKCVANNATLRAIHVPSCPSPEAARFARHGLMGGKWSLFGEEAAEYAAESEGSGGARELLQRYERLLNVDIATDNHNAAIEDLRRKYRKAMMDVQDARRHERTPSQAQAHMNRVRQLTEAYGVLRATLDGNREEAAEYSSVRAELPVGGSGGRLGMVLSPASEPPLTRVAVSELVPGLPAARSTTVQIGDVLAYVDGNDVRGLGSDEVLQMLKESTAKAMASAGASLTLGFLRKHGVGSAGGRSRASEPEPPTTDSKLPRDHWQRETSSAGVGDGASTAVGGGSSGSGSTQGGSPIRQCAPTAVPTELQQRAAGGGQKIPFMESADPNGDGNSNNKELFSKFRRFQQWLTEPEEEAQQIHASMAQDPQEAVMEGGAAVRKRFNKFQRWLTPDDEAAGVAEPHAASAAAAAATTNWLFGK
eukprot:g2315.t1